MKPSLPDLSTHPRRDGPGPADLILLGLAIVAFTLSGRAAWSAWTGLRRVEGSVARVRQETDRTMTRAREIRTRSRTDTEKLVSPLVLTKEYPPPRVLADLEGLLPLDVRLESATLRYAESLDLDLQVIARSPSAYDRFLERLSASPRFTGLVPGAELRDGEVRSSIKATYVSEVPR